MSLSRSSSSSSRSRPTWPRSSFKSRSSTVSASVVPRALVFGSPTASTNYDDFTVYSPIYFTNAKPPPPRPKLYASQSLPTPRNRLQKKASLSSVDSEGRSQSHSSASSSYHSSMASHAEEGGRYGDQQRGERYSIDSNGPPSHQRQPSTQPSISSSHTPSSSSSHHPQPSLSSSQTPQSQHSHSYSHTSQRSTASTVMDSGSHSSTPLSIPSTSVTPSSPQQATPQQAQRPSISSVNSSGSGNRPSMDDRRPSSQMSVPLAAGAGAGPGSHGMGGPGGGSSSAGPSGWGGSASRQNSDLGTEGGGEYSGGGIPLQFDEGVLRQLCDLDCALPLLTDRIKQSLASCRQVALFFKSRARVEEAYARSLTEMSRDLTDNYHKGDGKAGTFFKAYQDTLRIHDQIASKRNGFATRLNEMSDELSVLAKEMEKTRKQHKDTGTRFERNLQEADLTMEKAKARFDSTAEELERILINKEGSNLKDAGMYTSSSHPNGIEGNRKKLGKAIGKGAGLFKGKNPAQIQKQEDDVRQRMSHSSDAFRRAVLDAQSVRQEYFNSQLPKILRLLKQCADEVDLGTQYHISRYAYLYETVILQEGTVVTPIEDATSLGLKAVAETIDNRTDFKSYMQNFIVARGGVPRGPRREGAYEENYASDKIQQTVQYGSNNGNGDHNQQLQQPRNENQVFEVDLTDMMLRNGQKEDFLPQILEMCTKAIEQKGLTSMGIYRLSGMTSSVQKLKQAFDRDIDSVDLDDDAWSDINVIASTLKLWFRELPDPLFTYALYSQFMDAARVDNDRLRQIRLHEQINELPDANYAALKHFMEHLSKIRAEEKTNQMSASNLSIVFGPTLFRQPPEGGGGEGMTMAELMSSQCKAVETILLKYEEIFV